MATRVLNSALQSVAKSLSPAVVASPPPPLSQRQSPPLDFSALMSVPSSVLPTLDDDDGEVPMTGNVNVNNPDVDNRIRQLLTDGELRRINGQISLLKNSLNLLKTTEGMKTYQNLLLEKQRRDGVLENAKHEKFRQFVNNPTNTLQQIPESMKDITYHTNAIKSVLSSHPDMISTDVSGNLYINGKKVSTNPKQAGRLIHFVSHDYSDLMKMLEGTREFVKALKNRGFKMEDVGNSYLRERLLHLPPTSTTTPARRRQLPETPPSSMTPLRRQLLPETTPPATTPLQQVVLLLLLLHPRLEEGEGGDAMTMMTKMRRTSPRLLLLPKSKESKFKNKNPRNAAGAITIYEMPKREKRREESPPPPLKNDSNQKINNDDLYT